MKKQLIALSSHAFWLRTAERYVAGKNEPATYRLGEGPSA